MENQISVCGDQAVFLPELTECNECDVFEERLSTLENLLANMGPVELSKTDDEGETVTVTTVGTVDVTKESTDDDTGDDDDGSNGTQYVWDEGMGAYVPVTPGAGNTGGG